MHVSDMIFFCGYCYGNSRLQKCAKLWIYLSRTLKVLIKWYAIFLGICLCEQLLGTGWQNNADINLERRDR